MSGDKNLIAGRKDIDVVEFADYQHDMDELGTQAAAIATALRRQIDELRMQVAALVVAAGGHIEVHDRHMIHFPDYELTTYRNEANRSWVFEARNIRALNSNGGGK